MQQNVRSIPQNVYKLIHAIYLGEVNESHDMHLLTMIPYRKYTVLKPIYLQYSYHKLFANQMFLIPRENYQIHR